MVASIVNAVLNWLAVSVFLPIGAWLVDYWRIKKENKELKKAVEELKNAKTKTSIDTAYDNIP